MIQILFLILFFDTANWDFPTLYSINMPKFFYPIKCYKASITFLIK